MKGFILDGLLAVVMFTIASIIIILLAYLWIQFQPGLDRANYNASIPLNTSTVAKIDSLGNSYFLTGGQGTLLFFFFAMVVAMFISAYYESAGFLTLPVSLFFLIMTIFTSMILSDTAHTILTNPAFQGLVAQHFSGVLYLEDNLPLVSAALTIGYIVFVAVRRTGNQGAGGSSYANRLSSG